MVMAWSFLRDMIALLSYVVVGWLGSLLPNWLAAIPRMKEPKSAVRRQDVNFLLALHSLTTGHVFDWDRATVVGKGTPKYKREFVEAWNTTSTCVKHFTKMIS